MKNIENIFRNSNSPDELFDAFRTAVEKKINNIELFKILIANPFLSLDEIKMYSEKLISEIPENAYTISMWTAKVLEHKTDNYDYMENCIIYFSKALQVNPSSHEPFLRLIKLYNTELELPANKMILEIINSGIQFVENKSKIYYALADLFKRIGDNKSVSKYLDLAERYLTKRN